MSSPRDDTLFWCFLFHWTIRLKVRNLKHDKYNKICKRNQHSKYHKDNKTGDFRRADGTGDDTTFSHRPDPGDWQQAFPAASAGSDLRFCLWLAIWSGRWLYSADPARPDLWHAPVNAGGISNGSRDGGIWCGDGIAVSETAKEKQFHLHRLDIGYALWQSRLGTGQYGIIRCPWAGFYLPDVPGRSICQGGTGDYHSAGTGTFDCNSTKESEVYVKK